MAAPIGSKNALGNKGGHGNPTVQDRELSKKVRRLTLKTIARILQRPVVKMNTDEYELYKAILIKLAGTVLPRLNEISGPDGKPIPLFDNTKNKKK